ncbi:SBBP repeat-containing protein [Sphingomonas sp. MMS24-J45]|uniref:SBBP repeat-containing protein n=1 Tax=Sphingomonas sp. MMS24-J45 TaxID=3238806 RepID=UPI00384FC867
MLSGTNSYTDFATPTAAESPAVRKAKAQFTLAPTTPPWKQSAEKAPMSAQISAIKAMKSIVDTKMTSPTAGSPDVETTFTAYKALSKLQLLATAAARTTTTDAERTSLQAAFGKGLSDLQTFLGQAKADKVELSFGLPSRRVETVSIAPSDPTKFSGAGILDQRNSPLPGLTGNEVLRISLDKPGASDTVTVDLSQTVQPPTLNSVSAAINAGIAAIQLRNPDGSVVLDKDGNPTPRWLVHFVPDKKSDKWGFSVQAPNGAERVSIDQVGARDSLVVASGQTALDAPTVTQVSRIDDIDGLMTRKPMNTIAAIDQAATDRAKLTYVKPRTLKPVAGVTPPAPAAPTPIQAATTTQAIATDGSGFSYVVGTSGGNLQSNRPGGSEDLFLTKLNSEGAVVWQRSLGASGGAQGAAVAVAANGDVTVAGTVNGTFNDASADGDMVVARFSSMGDERFATVIHSAGADRANAVAVGADGTIFVGGKSGSGNGDAFLARIDSAGKVQERRTIDGGGTDSVTALVIGADGNLLALTNQSGEARVRSISATSLGTDLGSLSLGQADARAIAVASDGTIAVAGAASAPLDGAQVNAPGGGRDGFVTRIDSALSNASTSYIATASDDQVDSVAFVNGDLYVGGRTTGALDGTRRGSVDGFIGRIDAATGAIESITQFGQTALRTEPVRVSAGVGDDSVLGALGLHRGALNPEASVKLVAQTSLRAGDEFSLRVQGGAAKKVVIQADDTMTTLADRIRKLTGSGATVTTALVSGSTVLRIEAKAGSSVALVAGPEGKDALEKLGMDPTRLAVPVLAAKNAPKVRPGGNYGLALTEALNVTTAKDAAATLNVLKSAISTTQTAYRSLYWDDGKARLVDGTKPGASTMTPAQAAQLDSYKSALARLTPAANGTLGGYTGFK